MEFDRLINQETIQKEAIYAVENDGIVFLVRLYCRSLFELKLSVERTSPFYFHEIEGLFTQG
jgi:hypothetical protein